jgi:hypothetical protein
MVGKKPKLRPGKGAKGSVLTRFIKPKQPVLHANHRSDVILEDRLSDDDGKKETYTFRFEGMPNSQLLYASTRYVKIVEEGDFEELFDDPDGDQGEGKLPWANSKARMLLYGDLMNNRIPLEDGAMSLEEIYMTRPEFSAYDFDKFRSRLTGVKNIVKRMNNRAKRDADALKCFMLNHSISFHSHKGYIQWKGSEARKCALEDIANGEHRKGYRKMYDSRKELYGVFPYTDFCDKVRQEIQTSKYLHTLKVTGKFHKAS